MQGLRFLETAVNDPLLARIPFDYEALYYPLGFPVRVRSNSALTLNAADNSWSTYRQRFHHAPLEIRLALSESASPACVEPPVFRSQGHLLSIVADRENFAVLDLESGFAFGWATEATAHNQEYFRQCLLQVMVHPLLEIRHLITLHAACVIYKGKGILFAGESGAGKSSLSYACAKRGWIFVSDDACAFRRDNPVATVIGSPHRFRFREQAGELFSEFRKFKSTRHPYGKRTVEIDTELFGNIITADESTVHAIVFLNRAAYKSGPPVLLRVAPEDGWNRLTYSVWAVQMPAFEERLGALERLVSIPMFEMRYSEFGSAIDLLESAVTQERLERLS